MHKFKKPLLITISIILLFGVVIILFLSPIAKYLVEKYDEKYTGRQIKMNWAYVNPFTGYIHLSGVKIYESKIDSIFISIKGLSGNFAMLKMLKKDYEITEMFLDRPKAIIIQKLDTMNFDDLIAKFASKARATIDTLPVHFSIMKVKIKDGEFHYREKLIPIHYFIKKVNIESTGIQWYSDTTAATFNFIPGNGSGSFKGNFTINAQNLNYRLAVVVQKFNLSIIEQYLKDLTNYGTFRAVMDADIRATGNLKRAEELDASGRLAVNDFHFGKSPHEDYTSFKKFTMNIRQLNPINRKYLFDTVSLHSPYFKYERYDYSADNIQTMFGKEGANVANANAQSAKFNLVLEIAKYVEIIARNFFKSYYEIGSLAITDGDIRFNDFSLGEKFSVGLNPFNVLADSISKNNQRVNMTLSGGIKPHGNISLRMSINPKDSSDFDIRYSLQKIPVSAFNPYLISYTSYPFDRGTLELNGDWNVRNGRIQSRNNLMILDPRVSTRKRDNDAQWLPLRLLMFFVRENGNAIDYRIPITGNLKDPQFHWRDVIFDILKNIVVKPLTSPYRAGVKNVETKIEKSLTIKWEMRQSELTNKQEKFLQRMADFLKENPEAKIRVTPMPFEEKEKELILFFEAKKKYFLSVNDKSTQSFSDEDSIAVTRISVKDTFFIQYLNKQVGTDMLFTVQDKCYRLIGPELVNFGFNRLRKNRENAFLLFFRKNKVENRVTIDKEENTIPYNGYSFFNIEYHGDYPESLLKAYRQMNNFNEEVPRKKFKREHKKINSTNFKPESTL